LHRKIIANTKCGLTTSAPGDYWFEIVCMWDRCLCGAVYRKGDVNKVVENTFAGLKAQVTSAFF
jgi:hypothetical protein